MCGNFHLAFEIVGKMPRDTSDLSAGEWNENQKLHPESKSFSRQKFKSEIKSKVLKDKIVIMRNQQDRFSIQEKNLTKERKYLQFSLIGKRLLFYLHFLSLTVIEKYHEGKFPSQLQNNFVYNLFI